MASQDEYLRNFAVLLTERGVVPLTDPLQISVYNTLCARKMRPSDISSSLGIPSSSLHFVLDKMVDSGAIVRSKPDPEKKSVYYSNLALKIAGSSDVDEATKEEAEETFNDPTRYYSGMSSVANMLDSYTTEIGLGLDQLRSKYAKELADSVADEIGKGGIESSILKIKEAFMRITGFKFSVFALNPLTLVFEGDRVMSSKMDMMTQFVMEAIENSTEKSYRIVSSEDFSGMDTTRVKVTFERTEKIVPPYMNMSLPQPQEVDRFMMVELDGSVGLITSDVQIDIVDAVYERPLCVTDIVNKVSAPRSTVTSNILRMVEEGVISVFYSESGSAYYGLSCSILMKKSRNMSHKTSEIHEILSSTAGKEGAFMEGYLLYMLTTLKNLGFDTDYMMVVLGAKYMRTAGRDEPHNFDVFFGKMSEIAQAIGLSLNIVSVYPLTIGISSENADSGVLPAMTFVKGMAHQGLEIASNGIFVRSSEDSPADRKVSFKEIYPALSMTPVEGIKIEGLAEPATEKKKRTSSVKTALINRSVKEGGKPMRTVRYITGVTLVALLTAVIIFGFAGGDNSADADAYTIGMDESCSGIAIYDEFGDEMTMPMTIRSGQTLTFSVGDTMGQDIGIVQNGIAYNISSLMDENGLLSIVVTSDLELEELYKLELPDDDHYSAYVYNFSGSVSTKYAFNFGNYIDIDTYADTSGGMWIGSNAVVCLESESGYYISAGDRTNTYLWERYFCMGPSDCDVSVKKMPDNTATMHLHGDYEVDGRYITGDLTVQKNRNVTLKFTSTDGPVKIVYNGDSGNKKVASLDYDREFKIWVWSFNTDVYVNYEYGNIF